MTLLRELKLEQVAESTTTRLKGLEKSTSEQTENAMVWHYSISVTDVPIPGEECVIVALLWGLQSNVLTSSDFRVVCLT